MRPIFRTLIVPSLALFLFGCSSDRDVVNAADKKAAAPKGAAKKGERKAAPAFTLKDVDGRSVSLSDYKGKVVLLNFWATWCGPCKIEIPWFVEFEQKYKDRGFAVLGISMDEDGWEAVKPYLAKNKINYRVMVGDDKLAAAYGGVESLPTSFVLDKDGRIVSQHVGLVSKSDYENEIIELLGKRSRADFGVFAFLTGANHP